MTTPKTLMVLGAGNGQLPLIQRAVALGYTVVTADYDPENVGHRFSHRFVNCSTTNDEGILAAALELGIDGIVTMASDVATPAVGRVADTLGLPGCCGDTARRMSNKASFRAFQKQAGLAGPAFVTGRHYERIQAAVLAMTPPIMFKPVDSSGSRGVTRLDTLTADACEAAFDQAQQFTRLGFVCVEEFIPGVEVGGDAFMQGGELAFAVVTHKHKIGFVPVGHSLPPSVPADQEALVRQAVADTCRALGYDNGPLNFDVIVSPERAVVLEMSPRLGGNGISAIIERATGVDLVTRTIRFALGEPSLEWPAESVIRRPCGSWVFGSPISGQIGRIAGREELLAKIPEIFFFYAMRQEGDFIKAFSHSGNSLGYVLFDCPPDRNYGQIRAAVERALNLEVIEASVQHPT